MNRSELYSKLLRILIYGLYPKVILQEDNMTTLASLLWAHADYLYTNDPIFHHTIDGLLYRIMQEIDEYVEKKMSAHGVNNR